jgi:hypothetical protein
MASITIDATGGSGSFQTDIVGPKTGPTDPVVANGRGAEALVKSLG